jgi:hypothetical protein
MTTYGPPLAWVKLGLFIPAGGGGGGGVNEFGHRAHIIYTSHMRLGTDIPHHFHYMLKWWHKEDFISVVFYGKAG